MGPSPVLADADIDTHGVEVQSSTGHLLLSLSACIRDPNLCGTIFCVSEPDDIIFYSKPLHFSVPCFIRKDTGGAVSEIEDSCLRGDGAIAGWLSRDGV